MRKKLIVILTSLCLLFTLSAFIACKTETPNESELGFKVVSREVTVCVGESSDIVVQNERAEEIVYTSYNTAVASVSTEGKVTGVAEGRTFVSVKCGEEEQICNVTVNENTDAVFLDSEKCNLAVGSEKQFTAVVYRNGGKQDETVSWQISDAEKCGFIFDGNTAKFAATQTGEYTLTATSGNISASCVIRVVSANATRLNSPVVTAECSGSVTWNAVTDASGYVLYLNGEYLSQINETQADVSEYTSGLKAGEKISVAVEAVAGDNYDYIDSLISTCNVGHNYTEEEQGDISCRSYGNIKYACAECNHTYIDENVLTAHIWQGDSCSVCGIKGVSLAITNELLGWKMYPGVTEYAVLIDGAQVGKTTATNFDLSGYFDLSEDGEHTVDVHPVGAQSMYITTAVNVVRLNNDNFAEKLSERTDAYTFFVLTEDVNLSHAYSEDTLHNADGLLPADQLCSSPIEGLKNAVFEGNGFNVTVTMDGTTKTNNSWEIIGGLFGFTDNALIRNLRTDITIKQSGHLHRLFSSGALIAVMKGNTIVKDCYVKSRIYLNSSSEYNANGGFGAVAGIIRGASAVSVIENCIVDSVLYSGGTASGAPKKLVGVTDSNVLINNNAYVVNEKIPDRDSQMAATYQEVFMSWTLHSQNMLFASLSDLMFGGNGDYCNYNAKGNWESSWAYNRNPKVYFGTSRLYESDAWKGTSFAFSDKNGLTLCGRAIVLPVEVTPVISHGVLTWSGSASQYKIYNGETLLGTVSGKSYDLAKELNYTPNLYGIRIEPVGYNELITYSTVQFAIIELTHSNFVTELSNSSANNYYILTEDISVKYMPSGYEYAEYTEVAAVDGKISYISSFEGVLDGNGYGINILYKGESQFVGGLFGTMQNAVIRNLVYRAELHTWGNATASGGLVREIGVNSIVENCFISVRLYAAQGGIQDRFGAITNGASSATPIVRNCVVDAVMYDSTQSNARVWLLRAINGEVRNNMNVYNNAFILNFDALPEITDTNKADYQELYCAWGLTSENNYVYATLDDFVNGKNCNSCTYTNWVSSWENNVSAGKVYEGWQNTSFAYDETNGLTLCGKSIQTTV